MSGHSKWAQIKRQKGVTDQKRGALFTKLANVITIAAREGGGDPEMNFKLRLAMEKAKQSNMPKNNIERAVKRGIGEVPGVQIEEVTYEGFGPGGVALVIEAITDNKNRTASTLRHILLKYGGNLSGTKSVLWMFSHKGILKIAKSHIQNIAKEELELKVIDVGVEDIIEENDELTILTKPENLQKVKENLEAQNIKADYVEIELIAKDKINIEDKNIRDKIEKLFEELDGLDDIDNFYSNYGEI